MVAPKSDSSSSVSARKQRANRRNARQSTGPRSGAGKARSARNALTHGLFARVVLDGENQRLFELRMREYILTLAPQNQLELDLVHRIAICQWKIARCDDAEALHLDMLGARSKSMAREEVEKVVAEYGIEDIHDDAQIEDEQDRAILTRLRQLEQVASDFTLPAAANLALAKGERDNAIERMSRYQQRLQQQFHRCLAELEKLRGTPRSQWSQLPPSPYLIGRDRGRSDQDDETECNQTQPAATDKSNVQNEPTAAQPVASPAPADTCDEPADTTASDAAPECPAEPRADPAELPARSSSSTRSISTTRRRTRTSSPP